MRIDTIRDSLRHAAQYILPDETLDVQRLTGMFTCSASGLVYSSYVTDEIPVAEFLDDLLEAGDDQFLWDLCHESFYPRQGDYVPSMRFDPDVLRAIVLNAVMAEEPRPMELAA